MKYLIILTFIISSFTAFAQNKKEITPEYIQQQIAKGKPYIFAVYKPGSNKDNDKTKRDKVQMEHLKYLFGLREEGVLDISGPVIGSTELEGIMIFDLNDKEAVKKLLDADPMVKAGYFTYAVCDLFAIPGDRLK